MTAELAFLCYQPSGVKEDVTVTLIRKALDHKTYPS